MAGNSLQHLFGSVTAQVIGHRISPVQGRFDVQAANEIFGIVLVEVKCHLGHICPVSCPMVTELISGGAALQRGDRKRDMRRVKRTQTGHIFVGKHQLTLGSQTEAAPVNDDDDNNNRGK